MTGYVLHVPEGSFRAFKILIAAEYNGIDIEIPEYDASKATLLSPTGKAPVLTTPSGTTIFESSSIARYIARMRRDKGLTGNGSIVEEAAVDSWCDFCTNNIELPACVWWYPVAGYMPFQPAAYEKAKADLAKALTTLNNHLEGKKYLVNDKVTLADITIAAALVYPFKLVCDEEYRKSYGNVSRWFNDCVSADEFKAVIGVVTLCEKELSAPDKGQ
jgi:elongation factor 1-gamma